MAGLLLAGLALSMSVQAQKVSVSKPIIVDEGKTSTFKVFLNERPSSDVTVTLTQPSNSDVTVDTNPNSSGNQNTLILTTANWESGVDVTVSAAQDSNKTDERWTITISNDSSKQRKNVKIRVRDDDVVVKLKLNKESLELLEGMASDTPGTRGKFTVRLASDPVSSRTVNLIPSQNSDVTVSPTALTFNAANDHWKQKQTVTVSVKRDPDADSDTATIQLSGAGLTTFNLPVKVQDEEDQSLSVTGNTLQINEGATGFFQVKLGEKPLFNRTVRFNATNGTASNVTLTPPSLTFTSSDWNTLKKVTVNAGQDSNADDSTVTIYPQFQIIKDGAYKWDNVTASPVTVSVIDDDVGLEIQNDPLTVHEGESGNFSVRLSERPAKAVAVTLTQPDNTDITIDTNPKTTGNQTTLNFTTSDWGTFQPVEVTAAEDDGKQDDTATVNISGEGVLPGSVDIVVADDEDLDVGLVLTKTSLILNEGSSDTFTVQLNAQPGNKRTVRLTSDNPGLSFTPSTLSFEPSKWDSPESVAVTANQDENKVDENQPIKLSGFRLTAKSLPVDVKDDDFDVGVILSKTSLTLNEGFSEDFTIRLDAKPGNNRTVQLTSDNPDITFAPTSLTFTTSNWQTAQKVTVSAVHDDDKDDEEATIQIKGTSISTGSIVTVSLKDDDYDVKPTLSMSSLSLDEGASKELTISLDKQPGADRVVQLTSDNPDITFAPTSLTFTTSNWQTAQEVTVSAARDNDVTDDSATVKIAGAGITPQSLTVSVADDDVGLILSTTSLVLVEGETTSFQIKLAKPPASLMHVYALEPSKNESGITLSSLPHSEYFYSGIFFESGWNVYKTVYVRADHDADLTDESMTFSLFLTDGLSPRHNAASITVTVLDDDLLELSTDTLNLIEGESGSFTVKLTEPPSENVTVTLAQPSNPDVTFDTNLYIPGNQNTLTFTKINWRWPKTVQVNTAHDMDQIDEAGGVYVRLPGGGQKFMRVNVNDDDDNIRLNLSRNSLVLDEGETGSFTAKLTSRPRNGQTITLKSNNGDVRYTPGTLTFDSSNWDTVQTVTVTATADSDAIDDNATINLSGTGVPTASVTVSVADKHKIELILSESSLTLTENSRSSFGVKLGHQPTAPVTVTVSQPDNTDVTVSKYESNNHNTLTFSMSNWNSYQTVQVNVAGDADFTNDSASISLTAAGGGYDAETGSVAVTVLDDDLLELSTDGLTFHEGLSQDIQVKLTAQPSENVTVTLSRPSNPDITLDADPSTPDNQSTLAFTTSNWSQARTVTVNAAADDNHTNESELISVRLPDGGYKTFLVRVIEGDIGLILSGTSLTLQEDESVAFKVKLATQPTAPVTITLAQPSNTDVTVEARWPIRNTLTFSTSNWDTDQRVFVKAADDTDILDEHATITLTATGGGYDTETGSVAVKVLDDDFIELSTESLAIDEGADGTFTVKLATQPSKNVTVTLARSDSVDVDADAEKIGGQRNLEFTPSNWSTPQEVTVSADHDSDLTDEQERIYLTAPNGMRKSLSIQVKDDDGELILSRKSLIFGGPGESEVGIKLSRLPTADVTVTLVQPSNTDVTVDTDLETAGNQNTLTFTTSNWNTDQIIKVQNINDTYLFNGSTNISLTASGGGYDDAAENFVITIRNFGMPDVSPNELTGIIGKRNFFTVKLPSQPSGKVFITFTRLQDLIDTNTEIDGNQDTLTFTASNWNTPQRVTLDVPLSISHRVPVFSRLNYLTFEVFNEASDGRHDYLFFQLVDGDFELKLSTKSLTLDEGASGTFTAKLASRPDSEDFILISLESDNTNVTFSPKTLKFTKDNWNTSQTVTVHAAQDSDSNEDTATIRFIGAGVPAPSVAVSVTESQKGLSLSNTSLTMQEQDSSSFQVKLTRQPSANVTVTVVQPSNTDVTVDTDTGTAGNQNTLIFTASNWDTHQTVHVNTADDTDGADDSATISLTAVGGDYDNATGNVAVTVHDHDLFEFSAHSLTLAENSSGSVSVKLVDQPSENTTVTVHRSPTLRPDVMLDTDADTAGFQNTLTFTPTNWNAYQIVRMTAADDTDLSDESGSIRFSLPGGRQTLLPLRVNDDDDNHRLILSKKSLWLLEGKSADSFSVKLAVQPTADVTVTVGLPSNTDMKIHIFNAELRKWVDINTLTFTTSNWNSYQALSVFDEGDEDITDDNEIITLTAEGGGYDNVTGNISAKMLDDDLVVTSTDLLTLNEGTSKNLTVRLAGAPSENVTVTLRRHGLYCGHPSISYPDITYDTDLTTPGNQSTLTFTPSNWSKDQVVKISSVDTTFAGDYLPCIEISLSSDKFKHLRVRVIDNDTELALSETSLNLEEGSTKTFTVKMAQGIIFERSITLASTHTGVTVKPKTLTFSKANWNTPQTVTVSAEEDKDSDDETAKINLTSPGASSASVSVNVTDNDTTAGLNLAVAPPAADTKPIAPRMFRVLRGARLASHIPVSPTASQGGGAPQSKQENSLLPVVSGGLSPMHPAFSPKLGSSRTSVAPSGIGLGPVRHEHLPDDGRRSPNDDPPNPPRQGDISKGMAHRWRQPVDTDGIAEGT